MNFTAKIKNHTISDVCFNGTVGNKIADGTLMYVIDNDERVVSGEFNVREGLITDLVDIDDDTYELYIEGRKGDDLKFDIKKW